MRRNCAIQTESLLLGVVFEDALSSKLEQMRAEVLGEQLLTVESCDNRQQDVRNWLQARIDAEDRKIKLLAERIIKAMVSFKEEFKLDTAEIDASLEAAFEYDNLLIRLNQDDLPRFQRASRNCLTSTPSMKSPTSTANWRASAKPSKTESTQINQSLSGIDYNSGRYIVLELQSSPDAEIRDFQQDLRTCTEGAVTGSDDVQYSDAKFLQVKAIIDRFRGREGLTELDRRWTEKVSDVRNWFLFAASERWRADDEREFEHYSDSGGKSGGQKEKLAYTILAASLAYQFGLEWGAERSRSFRFVVIDEAFGTRDG